MNHSKKMISLVMATVLVLSLGACNKGDVNKTLELTVWETQGTDCAVGALKPNDIVAKWLEDKTKVKVKNIYGNDGGSWDAKLTKLVAGDNLPDIIHCGAGQGPAHFNKIKQLNQLFVLKPEIIQKNAPNLWKRCPKEFWDAMTDENGNILGIPSRYDENFEEPFEGYDDETKEYIRKAQKRYSTDVTYEATQCLYIRDDILKKFYPEAKSYDDILKILEEKNEPIGDELMDVPIYTTKEFVDFLYKIKDANIKENGKTVYPLGYNGGDNWMALTWVGADMMGYKNHSYTGTFNYKTKKYELMLAHDIIKDAARIQNELINDEVIETESLAQTSALYKEKVLNGQYAVAAVRSIAQPDEINNELERLGKKFRYRPFITQVPNRLEYPAFEEEKMWADAFCFTKQLDEDEVTKILKWVDIQFTDEFEEIMQWGPKEADLYVDNPDGTRKFKDEKFNKYFLENDGSAMREEETLGLGYGVRGSLMPVYPLFRSKYSPEIYNRTLKYYPRSDSGFLFPKESEHVKNVVDFPPTQIWNVVYANIPEVVQFWGSREQWESKITIALAAKPGEFDVRWQELINTLNGIVNINDFEKACTEAVQPYLK